MNLNARNIAGLFKKEEEPVVENTAEVAEGVAITETASDVE